MKKEKIAIIFITVVLLLQFSFSNNGINEERLNAVNESITPKLKWLIENIHPSSPPTVADLNYDNQFEVLVGTTTGLVAFTADGTICWNTTIGSQAGAITITDLQNDGQLEILVPFTSVGVFCFNRFGEQLWNYSRNIYCLNIFCIDINDDNSLEILFCSALDYSNPDIFCLNNSGVLLWKYRATMLMSSRLAVVDLDSDGLMEILVSNHINDWTEELLCLYANGTLSWSINKPGIPFVADLNKDGLMEIFLVGANDGIECFNATGSSLWNYTGGCDSRFGYSEGFIFNINQDSKKLEIITYGDKSIISLDFQGYLLWEYNLDLKELESRIQLCLADVDGNNKIDIIAVFCANHLLVCISSTQEFLWNLSLPSTGNIQGTPCVMDLDNNNHLELLIATSETFYCYEIGVTSIGKSPWYCYGGTVFQTRILDSDTDYLDDLTEQYWWKTDPQRYDTDIDLLSDGEEVLLYHTKPLNPDTDGDGFLDGIEIRAGSDPLDPHDTPIRQRILTATKALSIIIPSYIIFCFIIVLSIRKLITQPWYIIQRALITFRFEHTTFIPLEKLITITKQPKEKITSILKRKSFNKNNNILLIENHIYFLDKVDLTLMLDQKKEIISQLQKNMVANQTYLELFSQTKTDLQTIISLATELHNQAIL
ncbi:MAG: VCBS repeat-containing protein [Candidatus Heimdallarchaeota archaeon]|nr:VCBS repeat-containing protein [Candidatus Heimdallarchaeota archaeon]